MMMMMAIMMMMHLKQREQFSFALYGERCADTGSSMTSTSPALISFLART